MKKRLNNQEEKMHTRFSNLSQVYRKSRNEMLAILPEIARTGIAEKLGFESVYDYALQVGGLPLSSVSRVLRLEKRLKNLPKLKEAIKKVGISKVEIAAKVVNTRNEEFWLDKVLNMSRRAIEISVKEEKFHQEINSSMKSDESRPCFAAPAKVKISLNTEAQKSFNRLKKKMRIKNGINADEKAMEIMLKKLENLLNCKKLAKAKAANPAIAKNPELHTGVKKEKGRYIQAKKRHEVEERSEKICEYPGCTKAIENLHHKERFAKEKSHETLTALCKAHHEIVHNGFIINELDDARNWQAVNKTKYEMPLGYIDQKLRKMRGTAMLN